MALSEIIQGVKDAVGDLTSLSVETYTGKVTAEIKGAEESSTIDFTKLISEAKKDAGGSVHLRLASKYEFDGDATLFIADEGVTDSMKVAHAAAVAAGQTVRKDLLDLLSDSIKNL